MPAGGCHPASRLCDVIGGRGGLCYISVMTSGDMKISPLTEHLRSDEVENPDVDYQAWKERVILKALKEAEDSANMIPAEEVWKDLGLEH